jgi:hypothetical protein
MQRRRGFAEEQSELADGRRPWGTGPSRRERGAVAKRADSNLWRRHGWR